MENKKGFKYVVEGFENIGDFSKGLLALLNAKCSRKDTVINIKTYEDSWQVDIISLIAIEDFIETHLGKVSSKESINVIKIEYDDLEHSNKEIIDKMQNEYFADNGDYTYITIDEYMV